MNREQLSDAIGRLDDEMIASVGSARRRTPWWQAAVAVAACLCLVAGGLAVWPHLRGGDIPPIAGAPTDGDVSTAPDSMETDEPHNAIASVKETLAAPRYPVMAPRPAEYVQPAWDDWRDGIAAQRQQIEGQTDGMTDFYRRTMATFLAGDKGENRVYSPLSAYMALSMLAEVSEGDSRQQILRLLGQSSLSALRTKNSALWNGVYLDDGAVLSRLANSLWLAEGQRWQYDTNTAARLAQHYYASVFKGQMGDPTYDAALQEWINQQTDNLLAEQASDLQFDSNTALALASTVCFKAKWVSEFNPAATRDGVFHAAAGDVACRYMKKGGGGFGFFGDKFTAIHEGLGDGGYEMFFFLPNKGVSVDELLGDSQVLEVLEQFDNSSLAKFLHITATIPQFDVASDRNLTEGLQALGVTDVFDPQKGNFGGILSPQTEPVFVSKVDHAVRVAIDEEGVTAAAYTVEMLDGMGAAMDVLDFVLDRPFLFAITGPGNTVLFMGVVEQP